MADKYTTIVEVMTEDCTVSLKQGPQNCIVTGHDGEQTFKSIDDAIEQFVKDLRDHEIPRGPDSDAGKAMLKLHGLKSTV